MPPPAAPRRRTPADPDTLSSNATITASSESEEDEDETSTHPLLTMPVIEEQIELGRYESLASMGKDYNQLPSSPIWLAFGETEEEVAQAVVAIVKGLGTLMRQSWLMTRYVSGSERVKFPI